MINWKITALPLLALAAVSWALYTQISHTGELRERLEQRQRELEQANDQINRIEAENARQNDLIVRVTNERDVARRKGQKERDALNATVAASADACIKAAVPDDVARAAQSALDELWLAGSAAGASGEAGAATGAAAGLPAP
ncbi:MAG: hypothetical protein IPN63_07615 [Gammaproteobacteria bacterium]|nr:hypothetical protein [Gammaproteobacteria bacterium]